MKLLEKSSGKYLKASIEEVSEDEYISLAKDTGFSFDWNIENNNEVYKIFLVQKDEIVLGLLSLINLPEEFRIHLNLLEVRKEHQGKDKQIDFIAGSLIAFAAENAFIRGYYGFVSLMPKTQLIDLYQDKYGFRQYGRYLGIEGTFSQKLINKYLGDE